MRHADGNPEICCVALDAIVFMRGFLQIIPKP